MYAADVCLRMQVCEVCVPSASAAASLLADALSPAEWAVFRHVIGTLLACCSVELVSGALLHEATCVFAPFNCSHSIYLKHVTDLLPCLPDLGKPWVVWQLLPLLSYHPSVFHSSSPIRAQMGFVVLENRVYE